MTFTDTTVPAEDGLGDGLGDGLDAVAGTARLTAAVRARETERADRLFGDPYAAALAGDPGRESLAEHGDVPVIPVRTRWYDDAVAGVAQAGVRQFVLLAAGMDTRAYRLPLPADTVVYELDRPELLTLKGRLLSGAEPRCARVPVGVDLAADWTGALRAAGFQPERPACWLVEGLVQYLHEPSVQSLFDRVTGLSAPGSHVLTDIVGRSLLDDPAAAPMLERLRRAGAPWHFATDRPEELFQGRGWQPGIVRVGEAGHALGRWPEPDRTSPAQGYFAHATR
ncbi:class I SAM-dependent methyltransferase [Streptomyces sp. URMC 127]|uniref:class I SAM-dependent methyltransferase n=1 Tax=Streptomyces sp. URMC 127 TaxID=3423402 RepID=UPI003F1AAFBC